MISNERPPELKVAVSTLTKLAPQFEFRDCVSPRVLDLPDGNKLMLYIHDWYWSALDYIDEGYENAGQKIVEDAWIHAENLTRGHDYSYIQEVFHWTLPFEIRFILALTQAMHHQASNQFLTGIYDFMENFLHQVEWPTPDSYSRIIRNADIHEVIASQ